MNIPISGYRDSFMNDFAESEWNKTLAFLQKRFGLSEEDCKDVFQESFVVLHNNINSGRLDRLTSSLSSYFTGICVNKAREVLRKKNKLVHLEDDIFEAEIKDSKIETLLKKDTDDLSLKERKEALVRHVVWEMPSPCKELLWGFFRDNYSMKTLAQMYNYSSENSVKVTKHRCQNKFKARFNELKEALFN